MGALLVHLLALALIVLLMLLSAYLCRTIVLKERCIASLSFANWLWVIGSWLLIFLLLLFFVYSMVILIETYFAPVALPI